MSNNHNISDLDYSEYKIVNIFEEARDDPSKTFADLIRKRSGMYVGGTKLFGLINYLVIAHNAILEKSPSQIIFTVSKDEFQLESDIGLSTIEINNEIYPTGYFMGERWYVDDLGVVCSLSEHTLIHTFNDGQEWLLSYEKGKQVSCEMKPCAPDLASTTLKFAPDATVFDQIDVSPYILDSYLKRMSYLNSTVQFTLNRQGENVLFHAPNGIRDMFASYAIPFQLMHEPIHFHVVVDGVSIELIFAFQAWTKDWKLLFVNGGRAVDGGSHELGLMEALDMMRHQLSPQEEIRNGIVAVMHIYADDIRFAGCTRREVEDDHLRDTVRETAIEQISLWFENHPSVKDHIQSMEIFQYPAVWYGS